MSNLYREDTHVNAVQIFKSHDDHHKYIIQGQFLFQVSDYMKAHDKIIPIKRSVLVPVPFGINPSKLSSRIGLLELVYYSVLDSKAFSELTCELLAQKITAKIMSRFTFMTDTSCSSITIAVNVDMIYTIDFILQIFGFDHGGVYGSFRLYIYENDEEDMDAGDDDNDESENNEEDMDDGDDDNDDFDNDHIDDNEFSRFDENYFTDIEGFSEVTGLVNVKADEVLNSIDCCSICLEEFGSDYSGVAKAETPVCSHMFHRDCIHPWFRKFSNCCPLCRSVFIAQI